MQKKSHKKISSCLKRNRDALRKMMAEHEALIKFREDNRENADKMFEAARLEQVEITRRFQEAQDGNGR